jgi:PhnB protein
VKRLLHLLSRRYCDKQNIITPVAHRELAGHLLSPAGFLAGLCDALPLIRSSLPEEDAMPAQIAPMLAVRGGDAAIAFYQSAFGAEVLWHLGSGHVVAGLSIEGAPFFLADESPDCGTRGPSSAGFTTVRIELFVDDPAAVQKRAIAAGAVEHSPVERHEHETIGPKPIRRMLQGAVTDPVGHLWLIGKFLD